METLWGGDEDSSFIGGHSWRDETEPGPPNDFREGESHDVESESGVGGWEQRQRSGSRGGE